LRANRLEDLLYFMASITHRRFGFGLRLAVSLGLGAAGALATASEGEAPLDELAPLRWQHRIILVDARIPDAIERLQAAQQPIAERDILWFVSHQGRLRSNYPGPLGNMLAAEVERQYFSRSDAAVFLIGKVRLLEARARAEAALGDAFDLRAFHDLVLEQEAVVVPAVEQRVRHPEGERERRGDRDRGPRSPARRLRRGLGRRRRGGPLLGLGRLGLRLRPGLGALPLLLLPGQSPPCPWT